MISALFVQRNGVYFGLPDVDAWDEDRDARKYEGTHPVPILADLNGPNGRKEGWKSF